MYRRCATLLLLAATACTKPPDYTRCAAGTPNCPLGVRCGSDQDCGGDLSEAVCNRGVCMAKCGDAGACGPGQFCAPLDRGEFCLVPCDDSQRCPSGSGCRMYWPQRAPVCANSELGPACKSVVADTVCATTCGVQYNTTRCELGGFCPGRSDCSTTEPGRCDCWNNSPGVCTQQMCGPGGCDRSYNCHSEVLGTTKCDDEPHDFGGRCICSDGRQLTLSCGETSSCEHRCAAGCSIVAQDCPDRWASKCTYRAMQPPVTPVLRDRVMCVPLTDTLVEGASCTRTKLPDGGTEVGIDDCAAGLVCEPAGAPRGEMRCRKLCTQVSECPTGQVCARSVLTFPPAGFCLPASCSIGGLECGPSGSCTTVLDVDRGRSRACKHDGDAGLLDECTTDADCGRDLGCGDGVCRATCSPQRPCQSGTCLTGGELNADAGVPSLCY
ncbi:MAG: hypothetical protein JNK82_01660 [Myxococcaceae bacterium]|nr:hypothetical protein [Myxococcaceae bacterium]